GDSRIDYVVDVGRGNVVEEIEEALVGMNVGETRSVEFELDDDSRQSISVTVKEIKEKVLPPLDDELAQSASEFTTLADLRADIEGNLREQIQAESEAAFRASVADRLAEASKVDASGPLVEERTRELLAALVRQVERRGIEFETYLSMTGTDPNQLVQRLHAE